MEDVLLACLAKRAAVVIPTARGVSDHIELSSPDHWFSTRREILPREQRSKDREFEEQFEWRAQQIATTS